MKSECPGAFSPLISSPGLLSHCRREIEARTYDRSRAGMVVGLFFFIPRPPDNPGNNVAFGVRGTYLSECIAGHGEVRDAQTRIIFYSFW